MPIYPHLRLIFIHIPKTGGSSINEYFNLKKILDANSIKGNFICEQKIPGTIRGEYGKTFATTSEDLRRYLSKGDYIRIGNYIYQVHSKKGLGPRRINLACVDNARNLMRGNIAKKEAIFLGNLGKHKIYKKLVSDPSGNKIIPSKYHWGWVVTKTGDGRNLKQVFGKGIIRDKGSPCLELDHISIMYMKSRLNENVYNNFFKFCFVRNPYDRIVSEYFWKIKDNDTRMGIDCKNITFRQFVFLIREKFDNLLNMPHNEVSHLLPQYLFVCDEEDNLMVDLVAKYEDGLEKGLKSLFDNLGISLSEENITLPKSNTTRSKRKKYTEYYDQDTQDIIYSLYQKDFKLFGYDYDFS